MAGEVSFTPEAADYVATHRMVFMRSLRAARFWVRVIAISSILILVGISFGWSVPDLGRKLQVIAVMLGTFSLWVGAVVLFNFLMISPRAARLFQQQRALHRPFTFGWSDAGISFHTDIGSSNLAWSDYHGWLEARGFFLFMVNEELVHFAPKRALTWAQTVDLRGTAARMCPRQR